MPETKVKPKTLTPEETAAALKALDALQAQGKGDMTLDELEAQSQPAGPQPSTTAFNGRQKDGTFAPGNQAAKGNPFARRVARLRTVLLESVTEDDLRVIVKKILDKAKGGDLAAAKTVFDYTTGKPKGTLNPDALDAEENELRNRIEEFAPIIETDITTNYFNEVKLLPKWCTAHLEGAPDDSEADDAAPPAANNNFEASQAKNCG
jgi:hypothetical protein